MMQETGASHVDHYIDDFIPMGRSGTDECAHNARIMLQVCEEAGAPVEEDKIEGPANPTFPRHRGRYDSNGAKTPIGKAAPSTANLKLTQSQ
jgi:hypothetical protein